MGSLVPLVHPIPLADGNPPAVTCSCNLPGQTTLSLTCQLLSVSLHLQHPLPDSCSMQAGCLHPKTLFPTARRLGSGWGSPRGAGGVGSSHILPA